MRVVYPILLDDLQVAVDRAVRNGMMTRDSGVQLYDLALIIHELQKKVGTHESSDVTSHEARLRVIETLLGIVSPTFTDSIETVGTYAVQRQCGLIAVAGTGAVSLLLGRQFIGTLSTADIWARGYTSEYNVDVSITATYDRVIIDAAEACTVEWSTIGVLPMQSSLRVETYTVVADADGLTEQAFTAFASVNDYIVKVEGTAADPENPGETLEVEVYITKATNKVTIKPAMDDTTVVLTIIEVTQ